MFQNKLKYINKFRDNGILAWTKNEKLNSIYAQRKEITRNNEYMNVTNKYITKNNGREEKV